MNKSTKYFTRNPRSLGKYTIEDVYFLYFGHAWFENNTFCDKSDFHLTAAQWAAADDSWLVLRSAVFAYARERSKLQHGGQPPAWWWRLEAPEPRDRTVSIAEQLEKLGIDAIQVNEGTYQPQTASNNN